MEKTLMNSNIQPIDNPLVIARLRPDKFPRVGKMKRDEVTTALADILFKASLYKGYRYDEENARFVADALFTEILQDMHQVGLKNISLFEIQSCIKKAVLDDPNFFFSVSYLYSVLVNYCKGEGHQAHLEAVKINNQIKSSHNPAYLLDLINSYAGQMVKLIK